MKRPLKAGDRVRVYDGIGTFTGTVVGPYGDIKNRIIDVTMDGSGRTQNYYRKQCRRLVPKKKPTECHKLPKREELANWWNDSGDTIGTSGQSRNFTELCKLIYGEEK